MRSQVSAVLRIAFSSRTAISGVMALVVIDKINVKSLAVLKSKNNSPIGADCHSPTRGRQCRYTLGTMNAQIER
jgi:hypothetical protein